MNHGYIKEVGTEEVISDFIPMLHEGYRSQQVVNKLLDGSAHVQTIGYPQPVLKVQFMLDWDKRKDMDWKQATGEPIKIELGEDSWTGVIAEEISWSEEGPLLYMGDMEVFI